MRVLHTVPALLVFLKTSISQVSILVALDVYKSGISSVDFRIYLNLVIHFLEPIHKLSLNLINYVSFVFHVMQILLYTLCCVESVSYTHLDVYKRQVYRCEKCIKVNGSCVE